MVKELICLQIAGLLHDVAWQIVEAPANEHGKPVVLEGSDVLYTGLSIFLTLSLLPTFRYENAICTKAVSDSLTHS